VRPGRSQMISNVNGNDMTKVDALTFVPVLEHAESAASCNVKKSTYSFSLVLSTVAARLAVEVVCS
jgi:hypothetical protein